MEIIYFEQLMTMQDIIDELMERTNNLDTSVALSGFMMLIEEYCKANHLNMVETFGYLNETCKAVNAELGAYA